MVYSDVPRLGHETPGLRVELSFQLVRVKRLDIIKPGARHDCRAGCLEVTPPDPTVTNVSPAAAPGTGGTGL